MEIILKMDAGERELVFRALVLARKEYGDYGYKALVEKVAALPCGEPGCSFCDPNYRDYEIWEMDND